MQLAAFSGSFHCFGIMLLSYSLSINIFFFSAACSSNFLNKTYWHTFLMCILLLRARSWFKLDTDIGKISSVRLVSCSYPPMMVWRNLYSCASETNQHDMQRWFRMLNMNYGEGNSVLHQYLWYIALNTSQLQFWAPSCYVQYRYITKENNNNNNKTWKVFFCVEQGWIFKYIIFDFFWWTDKEIRLNPLCVDIPSNNMGNKQII